MATSGDRGFEGPAGSRATRATDLADLWRRWHRDRDGDARNELIVRFMPLARKLARRYAHGGEALEDLVQVASVGLTKAVDRFEPERGIAFASYAIPTIVGELKRHLRDCGWSLHVERSAKRRAFRVLAAERALQRPGDRRPTCGQLAQYLECDLDEVIDGLGALAAARTVSLDQVPAGAGDGASATRIEATASDAASLEVVEDRVMLAAAAACLSINEQRILDLRFYGELSQSRVAARLGISQMQVSRLERRALARLGELLANR
jgi:RNA polymerase sigma-B factor